MKNRNDTSRAVDTARAAIEKRPNDTQRATVVLVRPIAAKAIADGWAIALQTRQGMSLIGEMQLSAFLGSEKRDGKAEEKARTCVAENVRKIAHKVKDLPHLLAAAWTLCQETGYRPCRTLALCGAGAAEMIAEIDSVRKKKGVLAQALKAATEAYISASIKNEQCDTLRAKMTAAAKAVSDYANTAKTAESKYRDTARRCVALLACMSDLRKAYETDAE